MAKRGRPRGLSINPEAVSALLDRSTLNKSDLCEAAGIKPGHLSDMLYRAKGTSRDTIKLMASALGVDPAVIAPEFHGRFLAVRDGDSVDAA